MSKRIVIIILILVLLGGIGFLGLRHFRNSPAERLKRADQHFQEEQFSAARIEYLNVLRNDPRSLHAIQGSADAWLEQGAPYAAIPFLVTAVQVAPENVKAHLDLAQAWVSLGQTIEARKEALLTLGLDPANDKALLLLANTSFGEQAIAELQEHLARLGTKDSTTFHLVSAILAGRSGDLDRVQAHLEDALAADANSPNVYLTWASFHALKKDKPKTRKALEQASNLSELRSAARQRYAAYLAQQGELSEAQEALEAIRTGAPDHLPTLIQLASLHRAKKAYPSALELLERVLANDPTNPAAVQAKARVYLDQSNRTEAIATLELFDERTNLPTTKLALARLYLAAKNPAKARSKLGDALTLNPGFADASLLLSQIELRTGSGPDAITRLEHLTKSRPDLPQAQVMLADAYQRAGRFKDAADILRAQIDRAPNDPKPQFGLSRVLLAQNKPSEARTMLLNVLKLLPNDLSVIAELVSLELSQKDFEAAHAAVRNHPKHMEDWRLLLIEGRIFSAEAKWPDARIALLKALDLNPGSLHAYSSLVGTYLAEQKPTEAITELNKLIKANPSSPRHLMLLALLYEQVDDPGLASEAYEKLLRLQPDFSPALNNLAYLCSNKLQQLDRAEELARRAHALTREDPSIMDTLGWILYQKNNFAEALPLLEKSAEKLTDNHEVHYHLGMTQARMGQVEDALQTLSFSVKSPQEFTGIDSARKEFAALQNPDQRGNAQTVPELQAHLRQQPKDAAAHLRLALLLEATQDYTHACSSFEAAAKLNPSLLEAWVGQTRLNGGPLNKLDQAIETGRHARRLDDSNPEIAALLGHIALKRSAKGDLPWALGLLWEASEKRKSPQILYDYAWASYLQGDLPLARKTMVTLTKTHPNSTETKDAQLFLSLTKPGENGWASIAPLIEARLKDNPDNPPALMAQAQLHPNQAEQTYLKLLKRFPDFSHAKIRLGLIYARSTELLSKADSLSREVTPILSEDRELNCLRAAIAYRKKTPKRTIQLLEKEQSSSPLPPECLFYLGMAYLGENREEEGTKALRNAVLAGLPATLEKEAKKTLGQ